ncbi:unnamed protein product [Dimorphilus gyrociliatus]|uniref:Uncharacterized protein n=1 Tax=Dimorphilus gyrociliatus TaxID=2664684 RepID=A0A7I8VX55_9ANNE|nr:unnamed protein product [Dimorphilus gyrociliatus]
MSDENSEEKRVLTLDENIDELNFLLPHQAAQNTEMYNEITPPIPEQEQQQLDENIDELNFLLPHQAVQNTEMQSGITPQQTQNRRRLGNIVVSSSPAVQQNRQQLGDILLPPPQALQQNSQGILQQQQQTILGLQSSTDLSDEDSIYDSSDIFSDFFINSQANENMDDSFDISNAPPNDNDNVDDLFGKS